MEFITAEQFLKQDKEVQKVFIEWWQPSFGDLILSPWVEYGEEFSGPDRIRENITVIDRICDKKDFKEHLSEIDCIPGLTEGQLRKFIEDITGYRMLPDYNDYEGYSVWLYCKEGELKNKYRRLGKDLLQAYWKVACEIAKESLKH